MGLDQFAFKIKKEIMRDDEYGDVDIRGINDDLFEKIHDWRKHPNLQGWMEELYRKKGGQKLDFNMVKVRLSMADLDELKDLVMSNNLPNTQGFFFGETRPDEWMDDLDFIKKAKDSIKEGYCIYYDSWW